MINLVILLKSLSFVFLYSSVFILVLLVFMAGTVLGRKLEKSIVRRKCKKDE